MEIVGGVRHIFMDKFPVFHQSPGAGWMQGAKQDLTGNGWQILRCVEFCAGLSFKHSSNDLITALIVNF